MLRSAKAARGGAKRQMNSTDLAAAGGSVLRGFFRSILLALVLTLAFQTGQLKAAESVAGGPRVEKDAHAEAILWEVWVSDEVSGSYPHTVMKHYLRVMVFDERGIEMLSKVDIPHFGSRHISDIWAKTTKKNGEVVELKKDGIFQRLVAKAGGVKIKTTTLALPGLEPGAVVEYGWKERHEEELANYVRLPLQREYPVQTVRYHIKPLVHPFFPFGMRANTFHVPEAPFEKERDGFVGLTFNNLPALREEPDMPPENEVSAWILIYYAPDKEIVPDKYWKEQGKTEFERFKPRMKANDDVKRKAAELTEQAATDEEKLKKLFLFCRSSIKNIHDPAAGLTPQQQLDFKENRSPSDTLKRGIGTGIDIDLLFAALANAAGFDARYARMSDRSQYFFNPKLANVYFMRAWQIAVRVKEKWMFFDPASTYVPFGMLRWQEEGNYTLISDNKDPEVTRTEISPPDKSARRRIGRFELSEDGTLEGDVRIAHTGHRSVERRRDFSSMKDEERLDNLKTEIEQLFPGAEISKVGVYEVDNPELPLAWSFHIKMDGFAQRTGKRLFLQPSVFQRGHAARYPATTRKFPVYFHYPWMDVDVVSIKVPEGYELDHADLPGTVDVKQLTYRLSASFNKSTRELTYKREFTFGKDFALLFPKESYLGLKEVFDAIHAGDNHTITLKQGAAAQ